MAAGGRRGLVRRSVSEASWLRLGGFVELETNAAGDSDSAISARLDMRSSEFTRLPVLFCQAAIESALLRSAGSCAGMGCDERDESEAASRALVVLSPEGVSVELCEYSAPLATTDEAEFVAGRFPD